LQSATTLDPQHAREFWRYCVEGGVENLRNSLRFLASQIGYKKASFEPPKPLPKAGLYWPGAAQPDVDLVLDGQHEGGTAAIVFYRSTVQASATAPIDGLIEALNRQGMNVLPIYVSSLKDAESIAVLESIFEQATPTIILNGTAFAVSKAGGPHAPTPLDKTGSMVLQFVMSGTSQEGWRDSDRGLSAKDLTMHVVLPEIDGRVLTQIISFKEEGAFDPITQCSPTRFEPIHDRIDRLAGQAAGWSRLQHVAAADKRVAIILSNYPNKDGRMANGVGLDTPASTIILLQALKDVGYRLDEAPDSGKSLMDRLMAGPTNAFDEVRLRQAKCTLSIKKYLNYYKTLSPSLKASIEDRWGAPQGDPACLDGVFRLAIHQFGNIVIGVQPARGYNIDPKETYHDPALVPPHNYLAFYAWLRLEFKADALVHMGKHGNTEWLPGKALAL
ncbi:MAG: cobaltochelatase subunit CobN, partial [Hyphomicrobiales bacterium]